MRTQGGNGSLSFQSDSRLRELTELAILVRGVAKQQYSVSQIAIIRCTTLPLFVQLFFEWSVLRRCTKNGTCSSDRVGTN